MSTSCKYVLAVDEGTTGVRAVLLNRQGDIVSQCYREITQYFPQLGWVEYDPEEIWRSTLAVTKGVLSQATTGPSGIVATGITNQRETTILWNKKTGKPLYRAIGWQCRRTTPLCDKLRADGLQGLIRGKTGLLIDPYFSATKIRWILDAFPHIREQANKGEVCFGTMDSWLLWQLTGGKVHLTDYTNASRTMLFNIHRLEWDQELLDILGIPKNMLPGTRPSQYIFGHTAKNGIFPDSIPIAGIMGDQQAALFGQVCFEAGMIKNTYGTGCFLLLNTGKKPVNSSQGLLTTLFCNQKGEPVYVLEGSIFIAGAAIQWLRDSLGLIETAEQAALLSSRVEDTNGVYVIPAFSGLGAPYWDTHARGAILGITRGTKKEHIVRATLESIAYQTKDVLDVMCREAGVAIKGIRVDGGAAQNDWLMQFQANILNLPLERPRYMETTSLGVGFLAGLGVGYWAEEQISHLWKKKCVFHPHMGEEARKKLYTGWKEAVKRITTRPICT